MKVDSAHFFNARNTVSTEGASAGFLDHVRKHPSVLISVVIHGILIALAFFIMIEREASSRGRSLEDPFQIDAISFTEKGHHAGKPAAGKVVKAHETKFVPVSSLGMRMSETQPLSEVHEETAQDQFSAEALQFGNSMASKNAKLFRYLFKKMQDEFDRPEEYVDPSLYGNVQVKMWFSAEGEYLEDESTFTAEDPHFRAIAIRLFRKAWINPIPNVYLNKHEKFFIEFPVTLTTFRYLRGL